MPTAKVAWSTEGHRPRAGQSSQRPGRTAEPGSAQGRVMHQSTTSAVLAPVEPSRRIPALDVLRGFALLGILLMNIEGFVGPLMAALGGIDASLSGPDLWADVAIFILVQGKFYALFSLLFGMGFALMLARARSAGQPARGAVMRRLLVLLAIGTLHAFLVWAGDILMAYATLGLVLLLAFADTPARRLPGWALGMFCLPIVFTWLFVLSMPSAPADPGAAAAAAQALESQAQGYEGMIERQRAAYGPGGSYRETVAANAEVVRLMFTSYMPFLGPLLLSFFLAGAWFVRTGVILEPSRHAGVFRRLMLLGWGLGLPLVVTGAVLVPTIDPVRLDLSMAWGSTATQVGSALMALGYLGTIVVLLESPRIAPLLDRLAPAGRMALSNYLLQSVVCTLVFYGYGLGWFEQLPRAWQVPFVLVLFALQVIASEWWMQRFRHGPVEWLWRSLTYLRAQPMRRLPVLAG